MRKKLLTVAMAAMMTVAMTVSALAVDVKDTISGDLTVTGFFAERSDAVALKSGDSINFKFNIKSEACAANYETFVMAVTGAIGDAYTSADQEVLILRGDNWGWGGKMSDFNIPFIASDEVPEKVAGVNYLNFTSDVDFGTWQDALKAGFACDITIARDGNTLTYTAKMGDWTTTCTATSGIALPETCYVFFTGEKTVLTGITTTITAAKTDDTKTDDNKTDDAKTTTKAAQTGDNTASTVALLGLAAVGATFVVLASKKSRVTE